MTHAWQNLRPHLMALVQGESPSPAVMPTQSFVILYRTHIPLEESFLLPYAERTLSPSQIEALRMAMAKRRGVAY